MDVRIILSRVDHTLLLPTSALSDVEQVCNEALQYRMSCVIIPPCYISRIKSSYGNSLNVGTIVGYPHGFSLPHIKMEEVRMAIFDGADEIELCINRCDLKNRDFEMIAREIADVRAASRGHILKVILETDNLQQQEKMRICDIISKSGADYIKVLRSFESPEPCFDDVEMFKEHLSSDVRISASGGIHTLADVQSYIALGCDRVAASNAVSILRELGIIPL